MRALAAHISLAAVAFAAAADGIASRQWSTYAPLGSAVATAEATGGCRRLLEAPGGPFLHWF